MQLPTCIATLLTSSQLLSELLPTTHSPPRSHTTSFLGNFFMMWGEPLLGAKKEREKEEESSCLVSLHQYSIIRMQSIFHHSSNRPLFNLIKHNQPPTRLSFEARVEKNAAALRF
jgi:hypothetical protein